MHLSSTIANHVRTVYYGGNWTAVNLKDTLKDISWELAIKQVDKHNSLVQLVYHIHYFVLAINKVFVHGVLDAHDKFSFDHPPIQSQQDWDELLNEFWSEANKLIGLIELLPDDIWDKTFVSEKYGTYYKNIHGLIEHTHYHLGQLQILKKSLINSPTYKS